MRSHLELLFRCAYLCKAVEEEHWPLPPARSVARTTWLALSLLLIFSAVVAEAMSIEVYDTWTHYRQLIERLEVPMPVE